MSRWLLLCVVCFPVLLDNNLVAEETNNPESPGESAEVDSSDAAVRDSIVRSLLFLESGGVAWMDERGCMSCHHVPFMIWAHREAQSKGVMVDTKKLAEWDKWARNDSLSHRNAFKLEKAVFAALDATAVPETLRTKMAPLVDQEFPAENEFVARLTEVLQPEELTAYQTVLVNTSKLPIYSASSSGGGLDVLGQLLLSRDKVAEDLSVSKFYSGALELMARMQLPDGSWTPGNQFATMRNWPLPAANQATTMWAALAIADYEGQTGAHSQQVDRAISYVKQQPPQPDNHEWLATRLLFAQRLGTADETESLRQLLTDACGADGGWSWMKGGPSDPFTTGLTLYVLSRVGGSDPAVIVNARKHLLSSQQADGSWSTQSRNISNTTVPERLAARDEIYHYWGTAWATLGLLETL